MWHIRTYKLATTYKMILIYLLVNIYVNNQSTLYKVNGVVIVFLKSKNDMPPQEFISYYDLM
jgi:hypothetical protein